MKTRFRRFLPGPHILTQLTASRMNEILDAIMERTPRQGKGMRLAGNTTGFSYSTDPGGSEKSKVTAWDIKTGESLPYAVRLGVIKIGTDYSGEDAVITLDNPEFEFEAPLANEVLYIEFEFAKETGVFEKATLKSGTRWEEFPSPYKFEEIDGLSVEVMTRFYCLLWSFHDGNYPTDTSKKRRLGADIWARKIVQDSHYQKLVETAVRTSRGNRAKAAQLVPSEGWFLE